MGYGLIALIITSLINYTEQINQGDVLPLKKYQELEYESFNFQTQKSRVNKRETSVLDSVYLQSNRLKFRAFDREFNLILKKDTHLVANNINIELRYSNKPSEYLNDFFSSNYYTGIVDNEQDSQVILYFENQNSSNTSQPLIFAQIRLKTKNLSTNYYIEPLIQPNGSKNKQKYIVYKSEDVQSDIYANGIFNTTFCRTKYAFNSMSSVYNSTKSDEYSEIRKKRQSTNTEPRRNRCNLALVADHKFYREIGNSNDRLTTAYLMNIIASVNGIYTTTKFNIEEDTDSPLNTNYGFSIEKIIIHKEPSLSDNYNSANSSSDSEVILDQFGEEDWSSYCLAHLFTYKVLNNGVLGLAYVGSPHKNNVGGMCSEIGWSRKTSRLSVNTGLSSYKSSSSNQGRLLQKEAELVTAHEFGHNWGSEHDPRKLECTPSSSDGGYYIMYPYSNSGNEINNNRFSSCSINYISEVLKARSDCLKPESTAFCGNDRVEPGEECDGGMKGREGLDPCCDYNCKLRPNSECSDNNHYCCQGCKIAPQNYKCYSSSNFFECFNDYSFCDGVSKDCPSPSQRPKDYPCNSYDKGKCNENGQCNSLCRQMDKHYEQCKCSNKEEKCMVCCRDAFANSSVCKPIHNIFPQVSLTYLSEGRPCLEGICEKNICQPKIKDHMRRLWKIIEKGSISAFVEFARRNIVAAVIVISLAIWIPLSCCIHFCHDKRIKSEYQQMIRREYQKSRLVNNDEFDDNFDQ
ncbi:unnamed protein product [Brachionus calyciflorus]|uniref:ADAM17 n=1 Tax=Brachionus calyciflorus TaxID=104777 RepID=A0A813M293_9BILA|nr:unnamed protein product [Brachionus calyciflorus]